ncbi:MBL fold metallo-hydrolase [Amycolatopsis acidiphila]|uniref:MBL fold metallo-hydrolase n=1 Tax=Amycolatopsis acidiphila TaxID=715473 RepID=A0A558AAN5_9PSEU|nr:MBL fold metallo-hydrolase [Amycolatopsis acidiphila]TVT21315.1 MBL fold metallo-hydrolase [Amycolatopsis acidiphila]UIJ63528.1 MBL fold metallo-hydrolase [Amycolatopsis acidiphila]GHG68445.1 MBL fold metallo-hydrolase [Amycolatopsis acidiphila]
MGPDAAQLREVVDGVYAWVQPDGTWWVNNAGAIAGTGGTILVDTCATAERTRRFLAAVAAATGDDPPRWAVNTHQHGDHTYGNSLLPASTVLIGHEAMRAALLADPMIEGCPPFWSPLPDWGPVTRRVPDTVLRSELTLHTGARRVELRHPGYPVHTPGDVVVWLPAERVLFTGDLLFHGLTPMMAMGSGEGALRSLDWLGSFGAEHVVPGHGPVFGAAELPGVLAQHERYYRLVLETAAAGRRDGLTPLAAARRCDLGEFAAWPDSERLVLNLHREYALADGRDTDLIAALTDATTWNHGPLHTSV